MTRLSGYQPQYFPRLHYFARMLDSDIFEFSDYIQFVKKHQYVDEKGRRKRGKSYQADAPIKLHDGVHWLTVPVAQHGLTAINHTTIAADGHWQKRQTRTLGTAYAKAPQGPGVAHDVTKLLAKPYKNLAELNIATTLWGLAKILDIDSAQAPMSLDVINERLAQPHPFRLKKIVVISETDVPRAGGKRDATDWIIDMCRQFGADEYYFGGTSGAAYMDFERFKKAGIALAEQNWVCRPYRQQFTKAGFLPNLSIIDLLANEDITQVQNVLQSEQVRVEYQR